MFRQQQQQQLRRTAQVAIILVTAQTKENQQIIRIMNRLRALLHTMGTTM